MDLFESTAVVSYIRNPFVAIAFLAISMAIVSLFKAVGWVLRSIKRALDSLRTPSKLHRRRSFEPVHEVTDYHEGPRTGVADFRGVPHRFCSVNWSPEEGPKAKTNWDDDCFLLSPVDDGFSDEPVIAKGKFRVRASAPALPPGVIRPLEVRWTVSAKR